jgi:hypothetical protein
MATSQGLRLLSISCEGLLVKEEWVPAAYETYDGSVEEYFFDHSPGFSELTFPPPDWTPEKHMRLLDLVCSFIYRSCTITIA